MNTDTEPDDRPILDAENEPHGFSILDHLDDRSHAALLELAKHVV